jgi:hypothetical protein
MAWYNIIGNKLRNAQRIGKKVTGFTKTFGRKVQKGALDVADRLEAGGLAPGAQAVLRGAANVAGSAASVSDRLDRNDVAGALRAAGGLIG